MGGASLAGKLRSVAVPVLLATGGPDDIVNTAWDDLPTSVRWRSLHLAKSPGSQETPRGRVSLVRASTPTVQKRFGYQVASRTFAASGYLPFIDEPEAFLAELLAFLDKVDGVATNREFKFADPVKTIKSQLPPDAISLYKR